MLTAIEYLLMAENYALAARAAHDPDDRVLLIRISATYRNKALAVKLGKLSGVLRRCPFNRDELRASKPARLPAAG